MEAYTIPIIEHDVVTMSEAHMNMLSNNPKRIRSYFYDLKIKYAE